MAKKEVINTERIDAVIKELYPLVKGHKTAILKNRTTPSRLGAATEIIRDAVKVSSIGMYNGHAYIFTGKIYEGIRWEDLRNAVYEIMKKLELEHAEMNRYLNVAYACMEYIKSKELVVNPEIVVFNNCVYNITTDEILPHSKDLVQLTMTDFDYDPTCDCRRWEVFLDQVLPNRKTQACLQEFVGSIFIDRKKVKLEHMMILQGSGSNGKGVIFETLMGILGRDNVTNFGFDALLTGADQKKNVASMNGKRLNYCSEIQALSCGRYTDRLKAIISGEPMEARALYGENFMAYDLPLLMANANKLPSLEDSSYGMQRRILLVEFKKVIPVEHQDNQLSTKLRAEYSGIFNWIMEGRERFVKRGFKFSSSADMKHAMEEFTAQTSEVMRFMMEKGFYPVFDSVANIVPANVMAGDLYADYMRWCAANKVKSKTQILFSKELKEAGYTKHRIREGVAYEVYGKSATELIKQHEEDVERFYSGRVGRSHCPLFENGRMYGRGDFNAAFYAHVSRPWLSTMRIKGKLDGTFEYKGPTPVYDIDKLVARCEKLNAYMSDEDKAAMMIRQESEKEDVMRFNDLMKSLGKPYRKYVWGLTNINSSTFIMVDNEWEYSEENEKALIEEQSKKLIENM